MQTETSAAPLADAAGDARSIISPLALRAVPASWQAYKGPLAFVGCFAFLNAVMNHRYPAPQPALWYLVPSLDVVALFVVFALCGAFQRRVPRFAHGLLVAAILLSRVLRLADGVEMGAYYRNFNTVVDLPLVPEFVRLFYTTVPHWRFAAACLGLLAAFAVLGYLVHRALRVAERALAEPGYVSGLAVVVGAFALASPFEWQRPREPSSPFVVEDDRRLMGAFGSSIFSRLASELKFAANIYGYQADELSDISRTQKRLAALPLDLKRLAGRNVYLFVIESYGQCVVDRPSLAARVFPEYQRFEAELGQKGFQIASRVLDSSTYGGRSWLAHATLATGVRTVDQFQLELLRAAQPETLSQAFSAAGYRSVLVQPATRRETPLKDFLHFSSHYYTKDFGYAGPEYGWSPMPDQFVLDFVRRRELEHAKAPLFLEYALTSSHAPWTDIPPVVDQWDAIGDGSLYKARPGVHFGHGWQLSGEAADAYAESIVYDFEVLRRYLADFVADDSLVIVLGDHQPHSEVTARNSAAGVPVHVLSRNPAFIDAFRARGYTPGMRVRTGGPHPGLETFMIDLLSDFSSAPSKGRN
jgi:hypothetical protein